eukprot:TRINITY_DN60_c0_g1_i13.p1 TRINITY_DN60_c0_g1~~TRINITY_DN60_c0_g1_i13.p1  ORF type:complete len:2226 (-),score=129.12 TRINITY_DN60_c0_g1_i13:3394-9399(-)
MCVDTANDFRDAMSAMRSQRAPGVVYLGLSITPDHTNNCVSVWRDDITKRKGNGMKDWEGKKARDQFCQQLSAFTPPLSSMSYVSDPTRTTYRADNIPRNHIEIVEMSDKMGTILKALVSPPTVVEGLVSVTTHSSYHAPLRMGSTTGAVRLTAVMKSFKQLPDWTSSGLSLRPLEHSNTDSHSGLKSEAGVTHELFAKIPHGETNTVEFKTRDGVGDKNNPVHTKFSSFPGHVVDTTVRYFGSVLNSTKHRGSDPEADIVRILHGVQDSGVVEGVYLPDERLAECRTRLTSSICGGDSTSLHKNSLFPPIPATSVTLVRQTIKVNFGVLSNATHAGEDRSTKIMALGAFLDMSTDEGQKAYIAFRKALSKSPALRRSLSKRFKQETINVVAVTISQQELRDKNVTWDGIDTDQFTGELVAIFVAIDGEMKSLKADCDPATVRSDANKVVEGLLKQHLGNVCEFSIAASTGNASLELRTLQAVLEVALDTRRTPSADFPGIVYFTRPPALFRVTTCSTSASQGRGEESVVELDESNCFPIWRKITIDLETLVQELKAHCEDPWALYEQVSGLQFGNASVDDNHVLVLSDGLQLPNNMDTTDIFKFFYISRTIPRFRLVIDTSNHAQPGHVRKNFERIDRVAGSYLTSTELAWHLAESRRISGVFSAWLTIPVPSNVVQLALQIEHVLGIRNDRPWDDTTIHVLLGETDQAGYLAELVQDLHRTIKGSRIVVVSSRDMQSQVDSQIKTRLTGQDVNYASFPDLSSYFGSFQRRAHLVNEPRPEITWELPNRGGPTVKLVQVDPQQRKSLDQPYWDVVHKDIAEAFMHRASSPFHLYLTGTDTSWGHFLVDGTVLDRANLDRDVETLRLMGEKQTDSNWTGVPIEVLLPVEPSCGSSTYLKQLAFKLRLSYPCVFVHSWDHSIEANISMIYNLCASHVFLFVDDVSSSDLVTSLKNMGSNLWVFIVALERSPLLDSSSEQQEGTKKPSLGSSDFCDSDREDDEASTREILKLEPLRVQFVNQTECNAFINAYHQAARGHVKGEEADNELKRVADFLKGCDRNMRTLPALVFIFLVTVSGNADYQLLLNRNMVSPYLRRVLHMLHSRERHHAKNALLKAAFDRVYNNPNSTNGVKHAVLMPKPTRMRGERPLGEFIVPGKNGAAVPISLQHVTRADYTDIQELFPGQLSEILATLLRDYGSAHSILISYDLAKTLLSLWSDSENEQYQPSSGALPPIAALALEYVQSLCDAPGAHAGYNPQGTHRDEVGDLIETAFCYKKREGWPPLIDELIGMGDELVETFFDKLNEILESASRYTQTLFPCASLAVFYRRKALHDTAITCLGKRINFVREKNPPRYGIPGTIVHRLASLYKARIETSLTDGKSISAVAEDLEKSRELLNSLYASDDHRLFAIDLRLNIIHVVWREHENVLNSGTSPAQTTDIDVLSELVTECNTLIQCYSQYVKSDHYLWITGMYTRMQSNLRKIPRVMKALVSVAQFSANSSPQSGPSSGASPRPTSLSQGNPLDKNLMKELYNSVKQQWDMGALANFNTDVIKVVADVADAALASAKSVDGEKGLDPITVPMLLLMRVVRFSTDNNFNDAWLMRMITRWNQVARRMGKAIHNNAKSYRFILQTVSPRNFSDNDTGKPIWASPSSIECSTRGEVREYLLLKKNPSMFSNSLHCLVNLADLDTHKALIKHQSKSRLLNVFAQTHPKDLYLVSGKVVLLTHLHKNQHPRLPSFGHRINAVIDGKVCVAVLLNQNLSRGPVHDKALIEKFGGKLCSTYETYHHVDAARSLLGEAGTFLAAFEGNTISAYDFVVKSTKDPEGELHTWYKLPTPSRDLHGTTTRPPVSRVESSRHGHAGVYPSRPGASSRGQNVKRSHPTPVNAPRPQRASTGRHVQANRQLRSRATHYCRGKVPCKYYRTSGCFFKRKFDNRSKHFESYCHDPSHEGAVHTCSRGKKPCWAWCVQGACPKLHNSEEHDRNYCHDAIHKTVRESHQ